MPQEAAPSPASGPGALRRCPLQPSVAPRSRASFSTAQGRARAWRNRRRCDPAKVVASGALPLGRKHEGGRLLVEGEGRAPVGAPASSGVCSVERRRSGPRAADAVSKALLQMRARPRSGAAARRERSGKPSTTASMSWTAAEPGPDLNMAEMLCVVAVREPSDRSGGPSPLELARAARHRASPTSLDLPGGLNGLESATPTARTRRSRWPRPRAGATRPGRRRWDGGRRCP